jgi:hypothetical protein
MSPISFVGVTPEEIMIINAPEINANFPRTHVQVPIVADRNTCFRTMSALIGGIHLLLYRPSMRKMESW